MIQAKKINLAISPGHPLRRWIQFFMIFILKDEDEISLTNRLRVINFFDAEINLLRQLLVSQKMMNQAEQRGVIMDTQWGG